MSERYYPIVLAAISETNVRLKWIKDELEFAAFYAKFEKPGTELKEMKTIQSIFRESLAKMLCE